MPEATKDRKSQASIHDEAAAALKRLETKDPGLRQFLKKAYGYVVFPALGKAAVVVGGAYGRGLVFEKGKPVGYATIGKTTLGVDVGGDTFTEVIAFENREALERFKKGKLAFTANASAVLVKAGAAGTADYEKGAVAFVYVRGGMLLEASIGGQKFKFKPMEGGAQRQKEGREDGHPSGKGKGRGEEGAGGAEASGEEDEGEEQQDEGDESDEGEGDEESAAGGDGPSMRDRTKAGVKAAKHLQKAATGGRLGQAFGLWGAARQLRTAAAGAGTGAANLIKQRPVTTALVGGGLAAGAILLAAGLMGGFAGAGQQADDQEADDQEADDQEGEVEDQREGGDEGQADEADEDGGEDSGGEEEQDELPPRMAARGRSRA